MMADYLTPDEKLIALALKHPSQSRQIAIHKARQIVSNPTAYSKNLQQMAFEILRQVSHE